MSTLLQSHFLLISITFHENIILLCTKRFLATLKENLITFYTYVVMELLFKLEKSVITLNTTKT